MDMNSTRMDRAHQNLQQLRCYYDSETYELALRLEKSLRKADELARYDIIRKVAERIEYEIAIRA